MGLRDEINYPQSLFSLVTESCIMNCFYSLPFCDVQENQVGFDTIKEALSKPAMPLRSPLVQGSWESWRRERLCSEKKFRALLVQMSQTKAEMYSRVKPRVKAQRNVRWMNTLRWERIEVSRKFLVSERCDPGAGSLRKGLTRGDGTG